MCSLVPLSKKRKWPENSASNRLANFFLSAISLARHLLRFARHLAAICFFSAFIHTFVLCILTELLWWLTKFSTRLCATPKNIYHSYHSKRRDQSLHSLQIDWILHLTPNRRGWHRTSDVHVVAFTFQALNLDNTVLCMADEHVIAEDVATAFNTCGRTQVRRGTVRHLLLGSWSYVLVSCHNQWRHGEPEIAASRGQRCVKFGESVGSTPLSNQLLF